MAIIDVIKYEGDNGTFVCDIRDAGFSCISEISNAGKCSGIYWLLAVDAGVYV